MAGEHDEEQRVLMKDLVDLSKERSQMSAERSYMNAERTLSVWIRTALAAMIFGLAIDRFGLMLRELQPAVANTLHHPGKLTRLAGFVLIIYAMAVALLSAVRYNLYCRAYRKRFEIPRYHQPWLASFYAYTILLFGMGILVLMIWVP